MIRLGSSNKNRVLKLFDGAVTITIRPVDSILRTAAQTRATQEVRSLKDSGDILDDLGYRSVDWDVLVDVNVMAGVAQLLNAIALGEYIIVKWTGIIDVDGEPLPPNRDNIIAFMKLHAGAFLMAEAAEADKVAQEGNVCSPLLNGNGAGAGNIAKDAKLKTAPVRAGNEA